MKTIEDKALRNKLDKERSSRKGGTESRGNLEGRHAEVRTGTRSDRGSSPTCSRWSPATESADAGETPAFQSIEVGSRVITSFGNVGTVEKLDKETAEVLVGGMRLREKIANLRIAEQQAETRPVGRVSTNNISKPIDAPDAAAELNLIGRTTAEAEYELDRFIDEAYIASLPRVRIIHGYGTGALKNYVHHFLKNHELVEKFAFAPDSQGGNGATIADMKM
jgi:DNA mismatch repair protein MutS2